MLLLVQIIFPVTLDVTEPCDLCGEQLISDTMTGRENTAAIPDIRTSVRLGRAGMIVFHHQAQVMKNYLAAIICHHNLRHNRGPKQLCSSWSMS